MPPFCEKHQRWYEIVGQGVFPTSACPKCHPELFRIAKRVGEDESK